jgi:signal peptidase I
MKANDTLSVEDVRKICKRLVATKGDVVTVSQETSTPVGLIIRIKEKKIFKAISDSYFNETSFGNVPKGVREPDRVSIIPENSEPEKKSESEKEAEVKKSNSYRRYSDDVIRKICEAISEGTPGNDIVKKFGISKSTLRVIINKERHVDISDQYFTRDGYTITSKQTGKKYNLIPSHGGRAKITSATTTTTTATNTKIETTSTSNLVSEIRDLGLQILMNSKINDLPDDIKSQVKEIIENTIDSMSLRDISKLGG